MTNVKTNSIKAWLLAARPKTLTGAAIPSCWAVRWPLFTVTFN